MYVYMYMYVDMTLAESSDLVKLKNGPSTFCGAPIREFATLIG